MRQYCRGKDMILKGTRKRSFCVYGIVITFGVRFAAEAGVLSKFISQLQ
jgi:hypothetical protein